MHRGLRIGIYDAYLSTLGGGENFLAVFAEFLEHEYPEAQIDILTYARYSVEIELLEERFGVELRRTRVRIVPSRSRGHLAWLGPLRRLCHEIDVAEVSRDYDLFVNNTIYSLAPPRSPRSAYMCMFPLDPTPMGLRHRHWKRRLLAPYIRARRTLYRSWVGRYDLLLANSAYTDQWIRRMWGLRAQVLYPPVETVPRVRMDRKGASIIAVGRFFAGNHNKKHDVLIDAFSELIRRGELPGWQFHLVGGRTDQPGTEGYLEALRRRAAGFPIHFHVDAGRPVLQELLERSSLFWHATGFGEDQAREPEKLEHFGLSTLEAMTHGCVPIVFDSGGQSEIVQNGACGFLWRDLEQLREHTLRLSEDEELRHGLGLAAHARSQRFSRQAFREEARRLLAGILQKTGPPPAAIEPP
jgi:glycosyltransferase involved in cell wall biosynthesis